jgi:hypothetical protein
MPSRHLIALTLLVTSACSPTPPPSNASPPPPSTAPSKPARTFTEGEDYVVLERVMFLDKMGFDQPVEAFSLLLPRGWKVDGGVRWGRIDHCRGELVQSWVKAASADGKITLEVMPPRAFGWADDPQMRQLMQVGAQNGGCGLNQPFDAGQYITGMAQHELGATASDLRPDESVAAQMRANDEQANAIARQYGNDTTQVTTVSFGKLTWPDGTEGLAHAGVTNTLTRRRDMLTGQPTSHSSTMVFHSVVLRFPAARRDEAHKLRAMAAASHRINPVWRQAKDSFLTQLGNMEHAQRMEKIRLVGEQSRAYHRERMNAMDRQMRDWEHKQASQERQVKGFIQTIREVESWNDGQGQVELSAGYDQAWSRGDGRYILSNRPGFDPRSVLLDQAWQPMKRADP